MIALLQSERHEKIIDCVNKERVVSVIALSEYLGVSKVTVRKDLDILSKRGYIIKKHGGVCSVDSDFAQEIPYLRKYRKNIDEKRKIGIKAAEYIFDGDVIILDAGSTTLEIARNITNKNITVITNDVKIASELALSLTVDLIITGGTVKKSVYTVLGKETESFFERIHANKAFIGADAIDIEFGVTNRTLEESSVKATMIESADEVIVVSDHTKLGKKVFAFVCKLQNVNKFITDKIGDESKKRFEELGVEVIVVD